MKWTEGNVSDQTGRIAVVTGANAGIGFETARVLTQKGARVVLACRDESRGREAVARIRATHPAGRAELEILDLADLDSVRNCAGQLCSVLPRIDMLINNAGVMIPPESKTVQGIELQFGVNYLGHYAFTGLLLPALRAAPSARVVTLSSIAHRTGRLDLDNLRSEKGYRPWREYEQSKLACLMFALELSRRLVAHGEPMTSMAAHPGGTKTDLQRHSRLVDLATKMTAMPTWQGALPSLFAATDPQAQGGEYYGPGGFMEFRGYPQPATVSKRATDTEAATRLWDMSAHLSGVEYLQ